MPAENAKEAALANTVAVYPARNLAEVIHFLSNPDSITPTACDLGLLIDRPSHYPFDFADVKGQAYVKRGLEIAASGGHNVLMIGPPGSGKTMLAKRMVTILPDLTLPQALEITKIHSVMGLMKTSAGIVTTRPFRSPHHTCSNIALIGGGSNPKPGEVTLAHHGILFLDELGEFSSHALEVLRQPMEDHCVTVARANRSLRFPAGFMLVAAMNPCPCGFMFSSVKTCQCNPLAVQKYMSKISGPLLDRIDLHLQVPALKTPELLSRQTTDTSQTIKTRTRQARAIQQERFKSSPTGINAHMTPQEINVFCRLDSSSEELLKGAIDKLGLSARAHDKILKVARTIADLEGSTDIQMPHIAEAVGYRNLDRQVR